MHKKRYACLYSVDLENIESSNYIFKNFKFDKLISSLHYENIKNYLKTKIFYLNIMVIVKIIHSNNSLKFILIFILLILNVTNISSV